LAGPLLPIGTGTTKEEEKKKDKAEKEKEKEAKEKEKEMDLQFGLDIRMRPSGAHDWSQVIRCTQLNELNQDILQNETKLTELTEKNITYLSCPRLGGSGIQSQGIETKAMAEVFLFSICHALLSMDCS
jgi:hypothetical protein